MLHVHGVVNDSVAVAQDVISMEEPRTARYPTETALHAPRDILQEFTYFAKVQSI